MKPHPEPSYANLAYFEDELLKDTKAKLAVVVSGDKHHYARYEDASGTGTGSRRGAAAPTSSLHTTSRRPSSSRRAQGDQADRGVPAAGGVSAGRRLQMAQVGGPLAPAAQEPRHVGSWRRSTWRLRCCFSSPSGASLDPTSASATCTGPRQGVRLEHVGDPRCDGRCAAVRPVRRGAACGCARWWGRCTRFRTCSCWRSWSPSRPGSGPGCSTCPRGRRNRRLRRGARRRSGPPCSVCTSRSPTSRCRSLGKRLAGLDRHSNEVFSCQGIQDWKSFLRFHVAPDGRLTIYPIGIEHVARPREVRFNRTDEPGAPYFTIPEEVRAQLIEDPVVCE